jgi:hypothetical protein
VCLCVCVRVWQPEAERSFGRLKCRCEDNIKTELEENGLEAIYCICVVQSRDRSRAFVDAEMNIHASIFKFLTAGNCEVRCGVSGMVQRPYQAWLNLVKCMKR